MIECIRVITVTANDVELLPLYCCAKLLCGLNCRARTEIVCCLNGLDNKLNWNSGFKTGKEY